MQNKFEIGVSRHAPKKETGDASHDVMEATLDFEQSRELIEQRTEEILKKLEAAPAGTILGLQSSNIERAIQTEELLNSAMSEKLSDHPSIEVISLGDSAESSQDALDYIKQHPNKKFVIDGIRDTKLLGFKTKEEDPSAEAFVKWKAKFKGDENLVGKLMALHQNEVDTFFFELLGKDILTSRDELYPGEFVSTPETLARIQIKWLQAMKKIGEKHFPERSIIIEGISHNVRADFAALALLGENISLDSINKVMSGEFRKPLERSSVTFLENGEVEVLFRNERKMYKAEEFERLLHDLEKKSELRKGEWKNWRKSKS